MKGLSTLFDDNQGLDGLSKEVLAKFINKKIRNKEKEM